MRASPRNGLAFFLSVAVHAGIVAWGSLTFTAGLDIPDFELEWNEIELIDPDAIQGDALAEPEPEPAVVEPVAPTPETEDAESEDGEGEEKKEEEEEKKPPKLAKRKSRVDRLGPANSSFYMLLANKKVSGLPFSDEAVEVMAPLPDFRFIIQGGGFHPMRDFNYIVIASPDIRSIPHTFLAVEYKMSREELVAGIERSAQKAGLHLEWEERGGMQMANPRPIDLTVRDRDPRYFVILDDKVAVYVRAEFLPHITGEKAETDDKTAGNFVANLTKLRRFAARQPRAGLQLSMKDLRKALRGGLPFPIPNEVEVTAEAGDNPEFAVKLQFQNADDAKKAAAFWSQQIGEIVESNIAIRLSYKWLYDLIELDRRGDRLELRGQLTSAQAEQLLSALADISRSMLRRSNEEMEAARKERDEAWQRRKGGKLPPSAAVAPAIPPAEDPENGADAPAQGSGGLKLRGSGGSSPGSKPAAPRGDAAPTPPPTDSPGPSVPKG